MAEVHNRLRDIFGEIAKEKGLELLAVEIMSDHIHLFVSSPPKNSPSLLANWFKGISARKYNVRYGHSLRWTNSFYVGSAGTVTSETIRKYIEEQTNAKEDD